MRIKRNIKFAYRRTKKRMRRLWAKARRKPETTLAVDKGHLDIHKRFKEKYDGKMGKQCSVRHRTTIP